MVNGLLCGCHVWNHCVLDREIKCKTAGLLVEWIMPKWVSFCEWGLPYPFALAKNLVMPLLFLLLLANGKVQFFREGVGLLLVSWHEKENDGGYGLEQSLRFPPFCCSVVTGNLEEKNAKGFVVMSVRWLYWQGRFLRCTAVGWTVGDQGWNANQGCFWNEWINAMLAWWC